LSIGEAMKVVAETRRVLLEAATALGVKEDREVLEAALRLPKPCHGEGGAHIHLLVAELLSRRRRYFLPEGSSE
jgi:hypothetical protein